MKLSGVQLARPILPPGLQTRASSLAACSWFGVIHSGLPSGPIVRPGEAIRQLKAEGRFETSAYQPPYHWAAAYWGSAALLMALGRFGRPPSPDRDDPPTAA